MKKKMKRLEALILIIAISTSLLGTNVWAAELTANEQSSSIVQSGQENSESNQNTQKKQGKAVSTHTDREQTQVSTHSGKKAVVETSEQESSDKNDQSEESEDLQPTMFSVTTDEQTYQPPAGKNGDSAELFATYVEDELSDSVSDT